MLVQLVCYLTSVWQAPEMQKLVIKLSRTYCGQTHLIHALRMYTPAVRCQRHQLPSIQAVCKQFCQSCIDLYKRMFQCSMYVPMLNVCSNAQMNV